MHKVEFVVDGKVQFSLDVPDAGGEVISFDRAGFIKCNKDGNLILDTVNKEIE